MTNIVSFLYCTMKRRERQINCLEKCSRHCINPDNKKCVRLVCVWHGGISDSFITDCKEDNVFRNVCQSFCSQGVGVSHLDREPPLDRDPPDRDLLDRDSSSPAATASVDTHLTGIHSCFQFTTHSTKNNITAIITVILSTVGVEKPIEGNENINDLFIPSTYRSESDKYQRTNRKDKKQPTGIK